jgi:hypothetical protein
MSAPPQLSAVLPEPHNSHEPPKSGHRLAGLAVALSAVFISLCSLALAVHHGRTMQRLVEANSRPFIQFITSNGETRRDGDSVRVLTVTVSNPGAGAARIEDFVILIDGQRVTRWPEAFALLDPRATPATLGGMTYSDVAPSYLKAGSDEVVLRWPRTEENAALWDEILARGREHVQFEACYCSIFDECWIEQPHIFRPKPVRSCRK